MNITKIIKNTNNAIQLIKSDLSDLQAAIEQMQEENARFKAGINGMDSSVRLYTVKVYSLEGGPQGTPTTLYPLTTEDWQEAETCFFECAMEKEANRAEADVILLVDQNDNLYLQA